MKKKLYIRVDSSTKGENSLSFKKTQRGNVKRKISKISHLRQNDYKKVFYSLS